MDNLYDSLSINPNLSEEQKKLLYTYLMNIKMLIFEPYMSDYNFDNILSLIQSLKVAEGSESDSISYNNQTNTIILGKSPNNQEYNTYRSLIELSSQRYDEETSTYTSGLIINKNGKEYGKKLNNLLIDNLITINTGIINKNANEEEFTSEIKPSDIMVGCFERMVGSAEKLVRLFATGNGKLLYDLLSENLTEENALRVLDDDVETQRLSLCAQACELRRQKIEDTQPKM